MSPVSLEGILYTSRLFPLNQPSLSRGLEAGISWFFLEINQKKWQKMFPPGALFSIPIGSMYLVRSIFGNYYWSRKHVPFPHPQKRSDTILVDLILPKGWRDKKSAFGTFTLVMWRLKTCMEPTISQLWLEKGGSMKLPKHFFFGGGSIKFAAIFSKWWFLRVPMQPKIS